MCVLVASRECACACVRRVWNLVRLFLALRELTRFLEGREVFVDRISKSVGREIHEESLG